MNMSKRYIQIKLQHTLTVTINLILYSHSIPRQNLCYVQNNPSFVDVELSNKVLSKVRVAELFESVVIVYDFK